MSSLDGTRKHCAAFGAGVGAERNNAEGLQQVKRTVRKHLIVDTVCHVRPEIYVMGKVGGLSLVDKVMYGFSERNELASICLPKKALLLK